jgi:hypothetical protein
MPHIVSLKECSRVAEKWRSVRPWFTANGDGDHAVYLLLGPVSPMAASTFGAVAAAKRDHTWFGHVNDADIPTEVLAALGADAQSLPAVVAVHESSGAEVGRCRLTL